MQIVTYKGCSAIQNEDGSFFDNVFNKKFKSIKSFKKWATIFSYKYLNQKYRTEKTHKILYFNDKGDKNA